MIDPDPDPDPFELADATDEDGWDVGRDGRMAEHATADDTIETVPYTPDAD